MSNNVFESLYGDSPPLTLFNTGTLFDLMAGAYTVGSDGKFYLNGGLGNFITGLHGRGNTFKSTLTDALVMGVLRNYDDVQCFCVDTEHSKDKARIMSFVNSGIFEPTDVSDRFHLKAGPEWTINKVWDLVKQVCELKAKNKKALYQKTNFLDYHGKQMNVWSPTIIWIDSFSQLKSDAEGDILGLDADAKSKKDEREIENKKNKTLYMDDGNKKTMLMAALNKMCAEYGIIITTTAHTGDNFAMDGAPPSKELLHQKQKDKIKGVGSKFTTLTHVLTQVQSCKFCQDSAKKALYCDGATADQDLNELSVVISRNKVGASGISVPFVVSQAHGLLNDVSNLNFLRTYGYEGLTGGASKPNNSCSWLPETTFTRNNVREKFRGDYQLCRAMELVARYRYIQLSWNLSKLPIDFTRPPEQVFDLLTKSSMKMEDILNTTSNWSFKKRDREFMTLFDIIGQIK
jgi:hypothetical protein